MNTLDHFFPNMSIKFICPFGRGFVVDFWLAGLPAFFLSELSISLASLAGDYCSLDYYYSLVIFGVFFYLPASV